MIDLYRIGIIIVIVAPLLSCDEFSKKKSVLKDNSIEFNKFISDIKDELVYVKGGDFLMGDYGEQYGPERLPYDAKEHSKPLHKIDLKSRKGEHWRERNIAPETPAHVDWYEAQKYCHGLLQLQIYHSHCRQNLNGNMIQGVEVNLL